MTASRSIGNIIGLSRTSTVDDLLASHLKLNGLADRFIREHRFHDARKWRFDFAEPYLRLAIECEGGVWIQGRHTRGKGYSADLEKYNEAALLGWTVLRFTREHVKSGEAIRYIQRFLGVMP